MTTTPPNSSAPDAGSPRTGLIESQGDLSHLRDRFTSAPNTLDRVALGTQYVVTDLFERERWLVNSNLTSEELVKGLAVGCAFTAFNLLMNREANFPRRENSTPFIIESLGLWMEIMGRVLNQLIIETTPPSGPSQ